MRLLGLDIGTKTIGVAVSDPLGYSAQPLVTIRRRSWQEDVAALAALVDQYEVGELVIGLPRRLNGSLGPEARQVKELGQRLEEHLGLPARYWDERLTTVAAERALLAGDLSRRRRRRTIDRTAACLILQGYLERQRQTGPVSP